MAITTSNSMSVNACPFLRQTRACAHDMETPPNEKGGENPLFRRWTFFKSLWISRLECTPPAERQQQSFLRHRKRLASAAVAGGPVKPWNAQTDQELLSLPVGADARRRDQAQAEYFEDFFGAVLAFLAFHPNYAELASRLARAVTDHATPVGSGTVARTKRIPVEQRAEAAVIAWMRHRTTAYDSLTIPRIKGKRREVRRLLAHRSQELLARYRQGEPVPADCSLQKVLAGG
jgi:hypothetical protein